MAEFSAMLMLQPIMLVQPMIGQQNCLFIFMKMRVVEVWEISSMMPLRRNLRSEFLRFLACIAVPNEASVAMHEKRGYVQVAHFPKVGYKFEQWHDIVWNAKNPGWAC